MARQECFIYPSFILNILPIHVNHALARSTAREVHFLGAPNVRTLSTSRRKRRTSP